MARLTKFHLKGYFGSTLAIVLEPVNVVMRREFGFENWYVIGYDRYGYSQAVCFDDIKYTSEYKNEADFDAATQYSKMSTV